MRVGSMTMAGIRFGRTNITGFHQLCGTRLHQICLAERNGARGRIRTTDTAIFSRMLYQLSYPGISSAPDRWAPVLERRG